MIAASASRRANLLEGRIAAVLLLGATAGALRGFAQTPLPGTAVTSSQPGRVTPEAARRWAYAATLAASPSGATQDDDGATSTPSANVPQPEDEPVGKQSKRILWVIPNYRAVSVDTQLPPLPVKGKFWLATEDSFDYSSFVLAGLIAGAGLAENSTPEFHRGLPGFGRYYWHSAADLAVGNYLTEAIVPALTREDPRYYTLGHRGVWYRTGYALSRLVITRTDSGGRTFNFSEIAGNGAGAGISNFYYPRQERTWSQTWQKWALQVGVDGIFNIGKEFWPDINHRVFHDRY